MTPNSKASQINDWASLGNGTTWDCQGLQTCATELFAIPTSVAWKEKVHIQARLCNVHALRRSQASLQDVPFVSHARARALSGLERLFVIVLAKGGHHGTEALFCCQLSKILAGGRSSQRAHELWHWLPETQKLGWLLWGLLVWELELLFFLNLDVHCQRILNVHSDIALVAS